MLEVRKLTEDLKAAKKEAKADRSLKDKVATAEAERDAAIADLKVAQEEKERLNRQTNKLLTDLSVQQAKKEELERTVEAFLEELVKAKQLAVKAFKDGDDF